MGSSNKKLGELVEGVKEFERIEILEPLAEMNTQGEGIRLQLVPGAVGFHQIRQEEPDLMTASLQNLETVFEKLSTQEAQKTHLYIRFASMPFENYFRIKRGDIEERDIEEQGEIKE
jgi:hypothetical protein